jgi:hypothetical protein
VHTVIVVQRGGSVGGQVQTDALRSGATPTGGIETGFGGTADPAPAGSSAVAVLIALVVCVLGAVGWRGSRAGGR